MIPEDIEKKTINVMQKHLDLTNEFLKKHIEITEAEELEPEKVLELAMIAPTMIASDIIHRLAGAFDKSDKEIYNLFRFKVEQGLGLIENRKKDTKTVSKKSR